MTKSMNKIVLTVISLLAVSLFFSCDLDTPQAPASDNPWDPANPSAPRSPRELIGSVHSETSVRLAWNDMSGNEIGFFVEEQIGGTVNWNVIDSTEANSDTVTLVNRLPATEYHYRVFAFNDAGYSAPADTFLVLNTANVRPTGPSNPQVTHTDGLHVRLDWIDQSANESEFVIGVLSDSDYLTLAVLPTNTIHWMSDVLDPFESFVFRVHCRNEFGESQPLEFESIVPGVVGLSAPFDLEAIVVSESEIDLHWNDTNLVAESFDIRQSRLDTLHFQILTAVELSSKDFRVEGLDADVTYFYQIIAKNRLFFSAPSTTARASTSEINPWPPSDIRGSIENEVDVRLRWADNSNIEIGYELSMSVSDSLHFTTLDTLPASSQEHLISNLEPFIPVWFLVRAIGDYGNSEWIAGISIIPGSQPPAAPSSLVGVALSSTEILLKWADYSKIIESYEIEERYLEGQWSKIANLASNINEFVINGRNPNSTYFYRVRANNRFGQSDWKTSTAVITLGTPTAPYNLTVDSTDPTYFTIRWDKDGSPSGHDGFILQDSSADTNEWELVDTITPPTARFFVFRDPVPYERISFRICAFNEYGNSSWSNITSGMPLANVAFVACSDGGIMAVDVTDIRNPNEISRMDTPGLAQRIAIEGDKAYVADSYGGVEVIDISSPANLRQIGEYATLGRAYGITVSQSIAYVACGDSGVSIINFSNPSNPIPLSRLRTYPGVARSSALLGNYLYVAAQDRGVLRVDISNRNSPSIRNESVSPSSSQGICIDDRSRVIVTEYSAGVRALAAADLSEIGSTQVNGNTYDVVWGGGNDFFIANFNHGVTHVYTNPPGQFEEMWTLPMPDDTWGIGRLGTTTLFACCDNAGLKVIDVSSIANPILTSTFQTPGPARGVAVREYK